MSGDHRPTFGDLLRRRRLAAGHPQAELAERAGLRVRGTNDLERGARQTHRKDTVALLAALGLTDAEHAAFEAAARHVTGLTQSTAPAPPPAAKGAGTTATSGGDSATAPRASISLDSGPLFVRREREVHDVCTHPSGTTPRARARTRRATADASRNRGC
jgi:transcriptional regulator with XRE-family HTH domain